MCIKLNNTYLQYLVACVFMQLDKKVIEGIAVGDPTYENKSLLKASLSNAWLCFVVVFVYCLSSCNLKQTYERTLDLPSACMPVESLVSCVGEVKWTERGWRCVLCRSGVVTWSRHAMRRLLSTRHRRLHSNSTQLQRCSSTSLSLSNLVRCVYYWFHWC